LSSQAPIIIQDCGSEISQQLFSFIKRMIFPSVLQEMRLESGGHQKIRRKNPVTPHTSCRDRIVQKEVDFFIFFK